MTTTALVATPASRPIARAVVCEVDVTEALGEQIAALAMQLHAATYELLVLLREFDQRTGWHGVFASCAHWLHWRTGIDLGAAREKVRVAHALASLPLISATMQRGAISYAKVRALTRVATPANESALLAVARAGTAAHVEPLVRAWRRVDDATATAEAESRHLHRQLSTWTDDDGMVVIRGRLTPELGAVVQRALEAAADRLRSEGQTSPDTGRLAEEVSPAQRRADALGLLAEAALSAAGEPLDEPARERLSGTVEVDHGAVDVSAETSRRLSCDASLVPIRHGADGTVLDVGRKTRTVPPSIRRALLARDRTCRFTGCTSRRCDAHHVEHWLDGGPTSLDNLVLLCRRHHRSVHEGLVDVRLLADGSLTFICPDGRVLRPAPNPPPDFPRYQAPPLPTDDLPTWDGTPFDVVYAIDVLYQGNAINACGDLVDADGLLNNARSGAVATGPV
jgi:hypothetical protein